MGGVCLVEAQINQIKTMKARFFLPTAFLALSVGAVSAQPQPAPPRDVPTRSLRLPDQSLAEPTKLTLFSLDFPGGTPKQLVAAIEKAMGKPLNAIVPDEFADMKLPPLKMNNVDAPRLFQALELTSMKTEAYVTGTHYGGGYAGGPLSSYQQMRTAYGFKTPGTPSDDSIWYFYVEKPNLPPALPATPVAKVCRFYALSPYLERGLSVDDITTAIQTGWKMLGDKETPTINFHKDTKLLIAVGEPAKLETIDAVLRALSPGDVSFSERMNSMIRAATPSSAPALPPRPPAKPLTPPKTEP